MAKARRKMRRALMKKMRKGALTPGERRDLMELDREVNRANRQAAGIGGAGLAAALTLASKTGALKEGKDALGDFLDERAGVREERKDRRDQKAIEKMEREMGVRLSEGADRIEEEEREEDRQKLLARADEFERQERERVTKPVTDVDFGMGPEGPTRDEFDAYRRQRAEELGSQVDTPRVYTKEEDGVDKTYVSGVNTLLPDEEDALGFPGQFKWDDPSISRYVMARDAGENQTDYTGGFETTGESSLPAGPINEPAFTSEDLMRAVREDGPRAEEGREMPDPDRPVMTRHGMDLDTMIRMGARGGSEDDREAGLAADLSDYSPEEIQALFRPDLRQADGGNTPFLRQMRDRIRKKFR